MNHKYNKKQNLSWYRAEAIVVAKDFRYDPKYITQIENAKNSIEISQILATARKAKFG